MDCDTTGIEPDFALVKFKKLAGGGYFKIINRAVPEALRVLGYSPDEIADIEAYAVGRGSLADAPGINHTTLKQKGFTQEAIDKVEKALRSAFDIKFAFNKWTLGEEFVAKLGIAAEKLADPRFDLLSALGFTKREIEAANVHVCGAMTVEGAPHLKAEHYPVFDCANPCGRNGKRYLSVESHIRMMAAAQPFISGAISKTINMPNDATVEEITQAYLEGWKLGVKAVAIYRDGSKRTQPLNTSKEESKAAKAEAKESRPLRRKLPDERKSYTHKFDIAGHEGYITVGLYDDGRPGEIFVKINKEGSTVSGLTDAVAKLASIALQYGVPLDDLAPKMRNTRFEPYGPTGNPQVPWATSVVDYIFHWLQVR
ncbi:MAG: hypothetical protein ACREVB_12170, partial [Burkholderiales bacterium]